MPANKKATDCGGRTEPTFTVPEWLRRFRLSSICSIISAKTLKWYSRALCAAVSARVSVISGRAPARISSFVMLMWLPKYHHIITISPGEKRRKGEKNSAL